MKGCLSISSKPYFRTKNRFFRWVQNGQISLGFLPLHVPVSQTIFFGVHDFIIHVVFGQFFCTNGLRMLQNPRNASSLAPIGLVILPGGLRYFKQLCLGSKVQIYLFQMVLKFFSILLGTYRTLEKNSQDFRSKTLITMIF